jgi:DNA polymerase III alpha subunit (gram-positive type)
LLSCEQVFASWSTLLCLEGADDLVRVVGARGSVPSAEAARVLLAASGGPPDLTLRLLEGVVAADARLVLRGGMVRLAPAPAAGIPLAHARFCVLDLETTGLGSVGAQVREVGAVMLEGGVVGAELEVLVRSPAEEGRAIRRLLDFAGAAVLAGHNLRFDLAFLEREVSLLASARLGAALVDTLALARRLLQGRTERFTLAALADLLGTTEVPSHRALPDARATADVLRHLLGVASERGATTVSDVCALCAVPIRRER